MLQEWSEEEGGGGRREEGEGSDLLSLEIKRVKKKLGVSRVRGFFSPTRQCCFFFTWSVEVCGGGR